MILPIFVYGADVLRKKAKEIDTSSEEVRERLGLLIKNMWDTMKNADGVGLAAPQVGESVRVLIVDGTLLEEEFLYLKGFKRTMINPVVVEESKESSDFSEGCLSIPDIHASVIRPKWVKIGYFDENFEKREEIFDNFACRMIQHEMDHLDGVLFTDRAAPIRKKMLQTKLKSITSGKVKTFYKTKI